MAHDDDQDEDHEHDHGHGHEEPDTSDGEGHARVAREALEEGDLAHAAHHAATALAVDPGRAEWRGLLDRIVAASDEPDELIEIEGGAWFGHVAGRAYVLAKLGQLQEALDLLAQVAAHVPSVGYAPWVAEWLRQHPGRLDLRMLLHGMASMAGDTVGFLRLRASERAVFERWAPMALALLDERREDPLLPEARVLASGLLRRAGRFDDAVRAARASQSVRPSDMAASALGLALRAQQDWEGALAAFREAGRLDASCPHEVERSRVLLDAGRLDEAARELDGAQVDDDPELGLMRAWLRWRTGGKEPRGLLARLTGRARAVDPALLALAERLGQRADSDAFREASLPGAIELPIPHDATANVVRQVWREHGPGGAVSVTVSSLEGPSNRLALAIAAGKGTDTTAPSYTYSAVPEPDPRRPRRPVRHVLWMYRGPEKREVRQAIGPPATPVGDAVSALARSPYHLRGWWEAARLLGARLGPRAVEDLLSAMVHPPPVPPEGLDPVEWVYRNQLAAALALAHVDGGWEGSCRREALLSLVDGPLDWTTDAALIALRELALDEPATLPEIERRLWELKDEIPSPGHPWYAETLACAYLRLPGVPRDRRQAFQELLQALYGDDEADEDER